MRRTHPTLPRRNPLLRGAALLTILAGASLGARPLVAQSDSTSLPREQDYYQMVTLPVPQDIVLEVGGMETLPDGRLAIATRRGDVWLVENPGMRGGGRPHYSRFAQGLHEPLGIAYRDGVFYTAQRGELTRLRDLDEDGRADRYETVYSWPLSGNYHEYSFGPVFAPNGNMIVTLNLGWIGYGASLAKWRGWALEITPDGKMTPLATGLRSPSSFAYNLDGDLFYTENQGDWVGSGGLSLVEKGDFEGNPAGLRWTDDAQSPLKLKPEDIPDTGEPKFEVAKRVKGLRTPAVWLPHGIMGISTSGILVDTTRGAFGPFQGQIFLGDQGHSNLNRVFLEKVDGVYQGVVFAFREGFASGLLRQVWGTDGSMYVGQTSRGWDATGKQPWALQRLVWTGKVPFEALKVEARPDGFEVTFTRPVDRATAADPASYKVSGFIYKYHHIYGSPVIDQADAPVRAVVVSRDGLSARLVVDGLREGYIHEIKMSGVRGTDGNPLLHDTGYYTLNRIPGGKPVAVPAARSTPAPVARDTRPSIPAAPAALPAAKHQTAMPAGWNGAVDATITLRAVPGELRYDLPSVAVKAGSRVRLVFDNAGDMLHNVVVVRPGTANAVAEAAMKMGLEGPTREYIPASDDVLYHTSLLQPGAGESIYFVAPTTPGEYMYVCTFPGHGFSMQGVLRVTP
jgi:azurin/glucose/arabinose dehydrogenase